MRLIRDDKTGFGGGAGSGVGRHRSPIRETARRKSWRTIAALVVVMVVTLVLQAAAGRCYKPRRAAAGGRARNR